MWRAARNTVNSYKEESTSESEEDFEDGLDFGETNNESVTVDDEIERRRNESLVSETGQALQETLIVQRDEDLEPREHFSPVLVRFPVNAPALRPPIMVVFEDENGTDSEGALASALRLCEKLEWDQNDLQFFFNRHGKCAWK